MVTLTYGNFKEHRRSACASLTSHLSVSYCHLIIVNTVFSMLLLIIFVLQSSQVLELQTQLDERTEEV